MDIDSIRKTLKFSMRMEKQGENFYRFNKDFSMFYKYAASKVDDGQVRKFLDTLSEWENGHMEVFQNQYQMLMGKKWDDIGAYLFQ